MTTTTTAQAAATIQELKQALPEAGAEFWVDQVDKEATLSDATRAYAALVKEENTQLKAKAEQRDKADAERAAAATKLKGATSGRTALGEDGEDEDDSGESSNAEYDSPESEFDQAVRDRVKATGCNRRQAIQREARANPELHQAYLFATNSNRKSKRLLSEKYDLPGS